LDFGAVAPGVVRPGHQVVVQVHDPVGVAEVAGPGQPEAHVADGRAGGCACCGSGDQAVVTVAAPAATVAAGRHRAADAECALIASAARACGQLPTGHVVPAFAVSRLLQLEADAGVGGHPRRV